MTEDDYPEWDIATSYSADEYVIVISGDGTFYNNIYRSVNDGNTGNKPWEDNVDSPVNWNYIGKINRWKMFELIRNTQTINDSLIDVQITPMTRISSVALFNLQAEQVRCWMEVDSEIVYDKTINLLVRTVVTWSDYFFKPFVFQKACFFEDLPPFSQAIIHVEISRNSGDVKCGGLVIGNRVYLGSTEARAESDALNFSTVERNEFGDTTLVPRRTIPKTSQRVFTDKNLINRLIDVRSDLNAVPAVWSALDDPTDGYFNALFILGFYRKFRISAGHPEHALIDLELEEI